MKIKLFSALCGKETIYFDDDGKVYALNAVTNTYLPNGKVLYYDYFMLPLYVLAPGYYNTGLFAPEDDFTYEVIL